MHACRSNMEFRFAIIVITVASLFTPIAYAKKVDFTITSNPPGANVEVNGKVWGTTPLRTELDDWAFKSPAWIWSNYQGIPMTVSVSLDGYLPKTKTITDGPFKSYYNNGNLKMMWYVITSRSFHFKLERVSDFLGANPLGSASTNSPTSGSMEDIVSKVLPAVAVVKTNQGSGSGFFILESGVLVTNKHVVSGSSTVTVMTAKANFYKSDSIFIHPWKDLALVKITGDFPFSTIPIADPQKVRVGAEVIAIGSPGSNVSSEGLLYNTVTRGIVSAFRQDEKEGLLLQTDVSINPGNSGGPLINALGEVVGVNTGIERGKSGVGFAVFVSEIIEMLKEHFDYTPTFADSLVAPSNPPKTDAKSTYAAVEVKSSPEGADIYIDSYFSGNTPSKLNLVAGEHRIRISLSGFNNWERLIRVEADSQPTINAVLTKKPPLGNDQKSADTKPIGAPNPPLAQKSQKSPEVKPIDTGSPPLTQKSQKPAGGDGTGSEVSKNDRPRLKITILYETILNDWASSLDISLRAEPKANSEPLLKIASGTRIEILERNDTYYKARVNGITGYISKFFLKKQ